MKDTGVMETSLIRTLSAVLATYVELRANKL